MEGPIREAVREVLALDAALDRAAGAAREVIGRSKRLISTAHRHEDTDRALAGLEAAMADLRRAVERRPELLSTGTIVGALQEYAEAMATVAILDDREPPGYEELGIGPVPYVLGLADSVGELRRAMLDSISAGDLGSAERLLGAMRTIYDLLAACVVRNEVTPLRRKVDVARALVERSHGDLTQARLMLGKDRD